MAKRKYTKRRSYEELLDYYTSKIQERIYKYSKTKTKVSYKRYENNQEKLYGDIRKKLEQEYANLPLKTPNRWRTAYYSQFASYTNFSYVKSMGSAKYILEYLEGKASISDEWEIEEEMEFRMELQQWVNGIIPTGKMTKQRAIANVIYNQGPAYIALQEIINRYFPEKTSVVRLFYPN